VIAHTANSMRGLGETGAGFGKIAQNSTLQVFGKKTANLHRFDSTSPTVLRCGTQDPYPVDLRPLTPVKNVQSVCHDSGWRGNSEQDKCSSAASYFNG
jgi:hypothetical protein